MKLASAGLSLAQLSPSLFWYLNHPNNQPVLYHILYLGILSQPRILSNIYHINHDVPHSAVLTKHFTSKYFNRYLNVGKWLKNCCWNKVVSSSFLCVFKIRNIFQSLPSQAINSIPTKRTDLWKKRRNL